MKRFNRRTMVMILAAVVTVVAGMLAYRYDQPMKIGSNPDWETTLASLDVTREHVLIQSGDVNLEAELLIPAGGRDKKPAVIFAGGSGQWIYQAYAE